MKKLLLVLLCFPLLFSCGDENKKRNQKGKDIQGYWKVTFSTDSKSKLIFHFSEDGFLCTDVGIDYSCGENREIENCDDCHSDNNWKYIDKKKEKITMKLRGSQFSAEIRKESEDKYFLSGIGPGEIFLERISFEEIQRKYDLRHNTSGIPRSTDTELDVIKDQEQINEIVIPNLTDTPIQKDIKEKESSYGVINDHDGYTNVREEKSSKSEIVFKVYDGQQFEIIDDRDNNWWLIEYNGEEGYIYRDRIDVIR